MKIGFLTDSTCDLPKDIIKKYNIHILPIQIISGDTKLFDDKQGVVYQKTIHLIKKTHDIITQPQEPEIIAEFLADLILKNEYDQLLCLMPLKSRSDSFHNTYIAKEIAERKVNRIRAEDLLPGVRIEAVDSLQISVGLGILMLQSIYTSKASNRLEHIIKNIRFFSQFTQTYVIPKTLERLYFQGSEKGDSSVGLGTYIVGTALDIKPIILVHNGKSSAIAKTIGFDKAFDQVFDMMIEHIKLGHLMDRTINLSYGYTLSDLRNKPSFLEFERIAQQRNIKIFISNMASTLNVNIGLGSFAISFLSKKIPTHL
jgi:DegV family protein with EDD domain